MSEQEFQPLDIDDAFAEFMRIANPRVEEHSTQYRESRRVWVAAMFQLFRFMTVEVVKLSDEEGEVQLTRFHEALREYRRRISEDKD
jgi:hypothetical protein